MGAKKTEKLGETWHYGLLGRYAVYSDPLYPSLFFKRSQFSPFMCCYKWEYFRITACYRSVHSPDLRTHFTTYV